MYSLLLGGNASSLFVKGKKIIFLLLTILLGVSASYAQSKKDTLYAKELFKQGVNQIIAEHFGESLVTFQELLTFQEEKFSTFDRSSPAFLDRNLSRFYVGLGYLRTSKPKDALERLTHSLQQMRTNPTYKHDTLWVGTSQTMLAYIAECYNDLGLYDISIEHYLEAEGLAKTLNPFSKYPALSLIYTNIAITYAKAKDFKNSILYDYKALEMDKENKDTQTIAINYGNLAEHYLFNHQTDSAEAYLRKVFTILKTKDFPMIRAYCMRLQSKLLSLQNKNEIALDTLLRAATFAKMVGQKKIESQIANQTAILYLANKKPHLALIYADSAILYATDMIGEKAEALHTKANTQKALGLFERAFFTNKEAAHTDSLVLQTQLLNYIAGMETHIRIKNTLTQTQQEVTAKKKQLWVSWLIAISLILLSIALYYAYKANRKAYQAESERRIMQEKAHQADIEKLEMEKRARQAEAVRAALLEKDLLEKELAYETLTNAYTELKESQHQEVNVEDAHTSTNELLLPEGIILPFDSIMRMEAANIYVVIHTFPKKEYIIRSTLKKLETLLPSHIFCRVHRSHIINLNFLQEENTTCFVMKDGTEISRPRRNKPK